MHGRCSFIVVSWNARNLLLQCLESIFCDPIGSKSEIIVVDNASEDGSQEAVEENFPTVNLIRNSENRGFAAATNQGLYECKGDFIFLVNSDIKLLPGCLEGLLGCFEKNPRCGLAGPRLLNPDLSLQPSCMPLPRLRNAFCRALALDKLFKKSLWASARFLPLNFHDRTKKVEALSGAFWAVRREAFREVGPLDEGFFMYSEDLDWCKRFLEKGWEIFYCWEASAIHVSGGSSRNSPLRFAIELARANLRYWRKHHGFLKSACFWSLLLGSNLLRATANLLLCLIDLKRANLHGYRLLRSLAVTGFLLTGYPPKVGGENRREKEAKGLAEKEKTGATKR